MLELNLPDPRTKQPPADVPDTSSTPPQDLADLRHAIARVQQACEELRADLDWLGGQVASVRGHVTGGSRRKKTEEPGPENDGAVGPLTVQQINDIIRAGGKVPLPGR